jgi:hypothetical protein
MNEFIEALFDIADGLRIVSQGVERIAEQLDRDQNVPEVPGDDDGSDPR